jgi:hypothetical protein
MTNLWTETVAKLIYNEKTFEDVIAIYGNDFQITKDNFEKVAKKTNYYSGYGSPAVATDLTILGKGFIMKREEYDGAENWEYIVLPDLSSLNKKTVNIKALATDGIGWKKLKELNE